MHENLNFEKFAKSCTRAENISCATLRKQKKKSQNRARKFALCKVCTKLHASGKCFMRVISQKTCARKFSTLEVCTHKKSSQTCVGKFATLEVFKKVAHELKKCLVHAMCARNLLNHNWQLPEGLAVNKSFFAVRHFFQIRARNFCNFAKFSNTLHAIGNCFVSDILQTKKFQTRAQKFRNVKSQTRNP